MKLKAVSGIMLTLLLTSMLTPAFNIQSVGAEQGIIYIRADGSIEPPTAPISTADNVTYTFTGNIINNSIVVERDNIVVNGSGYIVQGVGSGTGIYLSHISNVAIKNMEINAFGNGIWIENSINNKISRNNIINNVAGIRLTRTNGNIFYCNNLINNTIQALILASGANSWDNGYVGNYWSDYTGRDTDGDFIGETPYVMDENNKDNRPLMFPSPLPTGCSLLTTYIGISCFYPSIYGDIIAYVNDVSGSIMYYDISDAEFKDTGYEGWCPSLYENFIAFIVCLWSFIPEEPVTYGLALYDISTGSIRILPPPHEFNILDLKVWKVLWPARVFSMHGDILALRTFMGVWVYNITTSSIIANPTDTKAPGGVSVYENIIAFSVYENMIDFIWYHDLSTNTTTNTGVPGIYPSVYSDIIVFQDNLTIKYYNISSRQVTIVGAGELPSIHRNIIVFSTDESLISADLNDDGDMEDMVIRYYDILTNTVTNTGQIGEYPSIYESIMAFSIYEPMVDTDLNCDGDKYDYVVRYRPPDTAVINVTTSTTAVVQSCPLFINVTVQNQGVITETFNVTAYYNTTPINITEVTLTSGNTVAITFTWNTTGVEEGDYAISAKATVVPGEMDTDDNTKVGDRVTVLSSGHDVTINSVIPSKTFVGQNYSSSIRITAKNYGNFTETFNITAYANSTVIDTLANITLTSGNSTTIAFTWNTTGFAKGNYTITAIATPVPDETNTTDNTLIDGWVFITIPGDVNGDSECNILDVKLVKLVLSGIIDDPNADIDNNGVINILDLKKMKLIYSGLLK